jgi:two-component system, OmpR family, KDP operon response regulator KdpE
LTDRAQLQILVVDDDHDLRAVAVDVLRSQGFEVAEASNGRVALDYLLGARTTPSLILLDLNMPVMCGRELMRVLRCHLRLAAIPILVSTSEAGPPGSSEQHTVARLQKPYSADQLIASVRRHARAAADADAFAPTSGSAQPAPGPIRRRTSASRPPSCD